MLGRAATHCTAGAAGALALALAAGCGFAGVPGDAEHGAVTRTHFHSAALGGDVACTVYLPPGGARDGERLPVVYLLHGYSDDETSWFADGRAHETADRLIAAGAIPRLMLVAPYGDRGFYVDGARGNWRRALTRDLPAWVAARYPTAGGPAGQAVIGNSMGGWGALHFGLADPGAYAAVASLSGALDPRRFDPARRSVAERLRAMPPGVPLPAIYADCGTADHWHFDRELPELAAALGRRRRRLPWLVTAIPWRGHTWSLWRARLDPALRFVGRFLHGVPPR